MESRRYNFKEESDNKEAVIHIRRVSKVVKGGKRMGFSALVAVGSKDGQIGLGQGKAREVPEAIRKAKQQAVKGFFHASCRYTTIPHEIQERYKGAIVLLKPATKGTGVIAGGAVRRILELSPIKDILGKSLGSSNHINVAMATIRALKNLTNLDAVAKKRGKKKEEIYTVKD